MTATIETGKPELLEVPNGDVDAGDTMTDEEVGEPQPEEKQEQEEPQGDAQQEPRKPEGGFQKRIKKLTDRQSLLEQQLAAKEQQLAALSQSLQTLSNVPSKDEKAKGPPKVGDYENMEQYLEDKINYEVESRLGKERTTQAQQAQYNNLESGWQAAVQKARGEHDDFDSVVGSVPLGDAVCIAIKQLDEGAELAYYLGENPDKAARLNKLNPVQQIIEIGKIAATLNKPESKNVSRAPKPITPVGHRSASAADPDDMSMDDYVAYRNEQRRRAGNQRVL